MRILVISVGDLNTPSTYFRIGQYLPYLKQHGCEVDLVQKEEITNETIRSLSLYDLVINQKSLLSTRTCELISARANKLIFDFDDAIWTRCGKPYAWLTDKRIRRRIRNWFTKSNCVITANRYLYDFARPIQENTVTIPMSVDTNTWYPSESKKEMLIGWSGTPKNLHFIEKIEKDLSAILKRYPHVTLAIHSGKKPKLSLPYRYVPYTHKNGPEFMRSLTLGLLPLSDDPFTRGKSPIKALQYLSSGVPIVGNRYGATKEIHSSAHGIVVENEGSWEKALSIALEQPQKMRFLAEVGRGFIERHHQKDVIVKQLLTLLEEEAKA